MAIHDYSLNNPVCGNCGRANKGPYTLDQCRYCWLKLHGGFPATAESSTPTPVVAAKPRKAACIHLGTVIDHVDRNGTECMCLDKWLHKCDLHKVCTKVEARDGIANCKTCSDYEVDAPTPRPTIPPPLRRVPTDMPLFRPMEIPSTFIPVSLTFDSDGRPVFGAPAGNIITTQTVAFGTQCTALERVAGSGWTIWSDVAPGCDFGSVDCCFCPGGVSDTASWVTGARREGNSLILEQTMVSIGGGCLTGVSEPYEIAFDLCDFCCSAGPGPGDGVNIACCLENQTLPNVLRFRLILNNEGEDVFHCENCPEDVNMIDVELVWDPDFILGDGGVTSGSTGAWVTTEPADICNTSFTQIWFACVVVGVTPFGPVYQFAFSMAGCINETSLLINQGTCGGSDEEDDVTLYIVRYSFQGSNIEPTGTCGCAAGTGGVTIYIYTPGRGVDPP